MAKREERRGFNWLGYILCLAIILTAIFMGLDMIKTFTAESSSIGITTENKFFKTAVDIDFKMDQTCLQKNESTGFYDYTTTIKAVENFDASKNTYELLVNNNPCSKNECGAGYLKTEYKLKFYNINGNVDCEDTLFINIQFFKNKTQIQILTKGNANAVSFWKSYIENEGLTLNIIYGIR